jgi:hypothetical protein
VASHNVEDRALNLWWNCTTSVDGVEVEDHIQGRLDMELSHVPGVWAGEFANIRESLVDDAERHQEVLKVV